MQQAVIREREQARRRRGAGSPSVQAGLTIALGFAGLIAVGTLLLLLPAATAEGRSASVSVALFTATSAVCVTGLALVDTGTYWSRFGQIVIMGLVELGGVGFGASATFLFWLLGRNISLSDRLLLREIVPGSTLAQVARTSLAVLGISLVIQAVGALILFLGWLARYPVGDAAYLAVFHTISAFCNAGFDVFGTVGQPGVSLAPDRHNPFIILPIALLVLIGGFGFPVIGELAAWRPLHLAQRLRWTRRRLTEVRPPLSLNTRLVVVAHLGLFVLGTVVIWLLESRNPGTLRSVDLGGQFLDALNAAVYTRSAGFVTVPFTAFQSTTLLVVMMLMFVGTASAGTGGGVKVNTVAAILASVGATLVGRPRPVLFKRTLTQESVNKALVVVVLAVLVITGATFVLSLTEPEIPVERLLFEVVSAFSTVGLTLDITPRLSEAGRVVIELMMFAGRLGPLTLVLLLTTQEQATRVTYAEEPVLVG